MVRFWGEPSFGVADCRRLVVSSHGGERGGELWSLYSLDKGTNSIPESSTFMTSSPAGGSASKSHHVGALRFDI